MGNIVNIQRYSLGDGPGIRTTVFLKGCPLRCLWCSNPESQDPRPEPSHRNSMCHHCGKCITACPSGAITGDATGVHIDRSKCRHCGACAKACIYNAMKLYGMEMTARDVLREVQKDDMLYDQEGGVTLSGGEVLMQVEFATEILQLCQEEGYHTAVETSGFGKQFELLIPYTDLFLFDVKCVNRERHEALTGVSNDLILENLKKAAESDVEVIVRYPFIPGYNTDDQQVHDTARLMKKLGLNVIHILPYHNYGQSKYDSLDRVYSVQAEKPGDTMLEHAAEILRSYGIICELQKH